MNFIPPLDYIQIKDAALINHINSDVAPGALDVDDEIVHWDEQGEPTDRVVRFKTDNGREFALIHYRYVPDHIGTRWTVWYNPNF